MVINHSKRAVLGIILLFLYGCYGATADYKARQEVIKKSADIMRTFCTVDVAKDKEWLAGNIFFKTNKASLTKKDKDVLNQIIKLHQICTRVILIIGHTSNLEAKQGVETATNLSYMRAKAVKTYLIKNNISSTYPRVYFCGSNNNRVFEDSKVASKYNQRVEIVFVQQADQIYDLNDLCLIS